MKNPIAALLRSDAWGIGRPRRAAEGPAEKRVQVYRRTAEGGSSVVGELWCEGGEFVFRYEPGYAGEPISAFPHVDRAYRDKVLWPFFEVRIPPLSRKDVRDAIEEEEVDADDPLEMLAKLGRFSVANPYELRLV